MKDLAQKYTGTTAARYDAKREKSSKWQMENAWFEELLRTLNVRTVLDAPVGAGRFLPLYRTHGIDATGLDSSPDMLAIARGKGGGRLVLGDIFNPPITTTFDLVVCVRFLNWLDIQQMQAALATLSKLSHRYIILTITTSNGDSFTKPNGAFIPSIVALCSLPAWHGWYRLDGKSQPGKDSTHQMWLMSREQPR